MLPRNIFVKSSKNLTSPEETASVSRLPRICPMEASRHLPPQTQLATAACYVQEKARRRLQGILSPSHERCLPCLGPLHILHLELRKCCQRGGGQAHLSSQKAVAKLPCVSSCLLFRVRAGVRPRLPKCSLKKQETCKNLGSRSVISCFSAQTCKVNPGSRHLRMCRSRGSGPKARSPFFLTG